MKSLKPAKKRSRFVSLTQPAHLWPSSQSLGSGVATNKRDEGEFRFTTTATCQYTNGETQVCGAWQPGQDFVKGQYKVEVFNKGFLVGTGAFKLK